MVATGSGTALEYYDYLIYALAAAAVFGPLFFPGGDPLVGTILALGSFSVGFLVRPLGGIVFGHFGDRIGRKRVLIITLFLMTGGTVLIGCLPTYDQIGIWAPIALTLLRVVQGLAVGGEFGGAALMAIEHAPAGRRTLWGSFAVLGSTAGSILAVGAFAVSGAVFSPDTFLAWGWRVPFLASALLLGIGLYVRFRIPETPEFVATERSVGTERIPFLTILRRYPAVVLLTAGALVGYSSFIYIVFTFLLTYGQTVGVSRGTLLNLTMLGLATHVVSVPLFAVLADKVGRRPVMLAGSAFIVGFAFLLFPMIDSGNTGLIALALILAYTAQAAVLTPTAVFFAELFDTNVRYSGLSLGFQLGQVLGGGVAPVVATALFASSGGNALPVAGYVGVVSLVSVVCLVLLPRVARSVAATAHPVSQGLEQSEPRCQDESDSHIGL